MVTEMITLKLETVFLKEIDSIVKNSGYQNRTEFIRNALREKMEKTKLDKAMMELLPLKGSLKTKTTDEELHMIRDIAFQKLQQRSSGK